MENLWTTREFPVDEGTDEFFFRDFSPKTWRGASTVPASSSVSLDRAPQTHRMPPALLPGFLVTTAIQRFEQSIAGKAYVIEVAPVSLDRWRAHIVRLPGVPTALMPFYGSTADEAAERLTRWLTRAHQLQGPR